MPNVKVTPLSNININVKQNSGITVPTNSDLNVIDVKINEKTQVTVPSTTIFVGSSSNSSNTFLNPVFNYSANLLSNIIYSTGETQEYTWVDGLLHQEVINNNINIITKTFNYTDNVLISITETIT